MAGIALPGGASFLTFGDSRWAAAYRPAISVVTGDLGSLAEAMTASVLRRLGIETVVESAVEPFTYNPRASVGPYGMTES